MTSIWTSVRWSNKIKVEKLVTYLQSMNERRSMSSARERRSFFTNASWAPLANSLKSASWAPLVTFIEERKMSAAQILSLKVL